MHKKILAAVITAFALSSSTAFAADAAAKPKPASAKPAAPAEEKPLRPELDSLDFFVGNWTCTGKTFASPMGPEHETSAKVHASKEVGDLWIHITYDENKTAANKMPYHAGVYMGYDAATKKFVEGCVDNFGGYCTQSSGGWNGEVITFEGTANGSGQPIGVRDTFIKQGAKELVHAGEMQGADKKWAQSDKETCHRTK
jgi:hypothetical protein